MAGKVKIQAFGDADPQLIATTLDTLLDADADSLWVAQGHRLHGADRAGDLWRRTLLAVGDDGIVGAGTVVSSRIHPGRRPASIEVRPDCRRRGIGSQLLAALRTITPDGRPLAGKVRPNSPAAAFVEAHAGLIYQHCGGAIVDPREPAVAAWCAQESSVLEQSSPGLGVGPLTGLDQQRWATVFTQQYIWVHQKWSPVGSRTALLEVAAEELAAVDPEISTVGWIGDRPAAVVWVFRADDVALEVVAETVQRNEANGILMLGAAVARTLSAASRAGIGELEFDGHHSDPQLAPILQQLPISRANPLNLVEIRPTEPG